MPEGFGWNRGRVRVVLGSTPCRVGLAAVGSVGLVGSVESNWDLGRVEVRSGSRWGRVEVRWTLCRDGQGRDLSRVGVGSGSCWVDSVSSRAGWSWGVGRVGVGSGSCRGRLEVESGGVALGSVSNQGQVGIALIARNVKEVSMILIDTKTSFVCHAVSCCEVNAADTLRAIQCHP